MTAPHSLLVALPCAGVLLRRSWSRFRLSAQGGLGRLRRARLTAAMPAPLPGIGRKRRNENRCIIGQFP